ncbi:class I SAM-dependent methyltransferase [Methanolobus chelungpuianus]|uniref:SAM-dependent methlyltransferase n=1 Tax=Methanolobus chelungpuianus TaxID=502115 RepID=A0AAE3H9A8_9EURY|nr:class I SAM-dependent methyltransferase [Methanolobus chelungpuianus]MCQ6961904.1 SAM-dependent methlyltransferase [Methanolobus chelungpuianus]
MSRQITPWSCLKGKDIPATIELDSVIYGYAYPGCRILDIGCGTGKASIPMASHGFSVTGIDINQEALRIASSSSRSSCPASIPLFVHADATSMPFPDGSFDLALMQAFLTTISTREDRATIVKETCRVLKPGGHLYLADFGQTWHSGIYRERYIHDLPVTKEDGSIIAYDPETGEVAYIAHHFTEKELVFLLLENGFEIGFFRNEEFMTRTGNKINGFVLVGVKIGDRT